MVSYELLAGAKPYKLKRGSAAELEETIATVDAPLASATATDPAAKRDLRGDLDAILNKALKKNSNERYATVDALSQDIESHLAGHRVVARPDSLAYRITRFARRFRMPLIAAALITAAFAVGLGVGAAALLAIVFAAGMGIALWQARAATRERDRALRLVERQEGVLTFLNKLITEAARGGRALTAEELLQRSEALIGPELESDTEVHAMVLSLISASMQTLGNSAEAIRLSDRALGLVRDSRDPDVLDVIVINACPRGRLDRPLCRSAQCARNGAQSAGRRCGATHRSVTFTWHSWRMRTMTPRRPCTMPRPRCAAYAASVGPLAALKRRS